MPVDKNVRGLERGSIRIKSVAVFKVPLHLEIELLGKIASEIDSCAPQTKPIFQGGLAETAFKRRDITLFEIHLDKSAQHQFQFSSPLLHVNRRFLFFNDGFLELRFSVITNFLFQFPLGNESLRIGSGFRSERLDS